MYPSSSFQTNGIFVHQHVLALRSLGCNVVVISPVPKTPAPLRYLRRRWKKYADIPPRATIDGITIYYPRYTVLPRLKLLVKSGTWLYRAIRSKVVYLHRQKAIDILDVHQLIPEGMAASLLRDRLGIPAVVTIHGKDIFLIPQLKDRYRRALSDVSSSADEIVVVSKRLGDTAMKYNALFSGYQIISNGFSLPATTQLATVQKIQSQIVRIVTVCSLIPRKNVLDTMNALVSMRNRSHNFQFIVVGDGSERKHLEAYIRENNAGNYIRLLGELVHDDAMAEIASADIFCMPSHDEAFGVAYIEALGLGKPIVGCFGEGPDSIIRKCKCGILVNAGDKIELENALEYLINNICVRREMGERGRKYVDQNFGWEKNASEYLRLFKRLVTVDDCTYL
jgi:teichuronic acid biosynthesis glycosyltransferase TuaC